MSCRPSGAESAWPVLGFPVLGFPVLGFPVLGFLALGLLTSSCAKRAEPPGAAVDDGARAKTSIQLGRQGRVPTPAAEGSASAVLGTRDDNLPFEPTGLKLASTALRTWIYTDTGPRRTRYGYLRAGAIVDARGPKIENDGCMGGWYRINPRGFVCLGKGATLDESDPIVVEARTRPERGRALPYLYVMADDKPPLFYFRLPSRSQMLEAEGQIAGRVARFRERASFRGYEQLVAQPTSPPHFLVGAERFHKPYGAQKRLHFQTHSGRASEDSGFAVQITFEWQDRVFGFTTEHDLIALDNTQPVQPSTFKGIELGPDESLPVAFVKNRYVARHRSAENGQLTASGAFEYREALRLTGNRPVDGFLESTSGDWAPASTLRVIEARSSFPSVATGTRKWIDLSIRDQSLVAYVGKRPVYATLVSTGRGGVGDPERDQATIQGTFMIHSKHVTATMDGEEDRGDSFNLYDVPFVQYFHKGFALHGTYWHDEFGKLRSHGCVNLSPVDSAWLFEWTDPGVPDDWHGALNQERGTVVYIHP